MKALIKSLALLALLAISFAPATVRAQDDDQGVSFQTFYDQLGSQGTWIQTDDYGYVFQPNVQDPDWAPYTDGHWVNTDQGWTWVSDEPWGWATYHYGRWANIDGTGWVWVPGYRWAPAWVSWRYGGGYAGWAPLPPETFEGAEYGDPGVDVGVGFHFGNDVDVSFGIGAGCYNFIRVGDFGERNYRGHYEDHNNNYGIINRTTNITNVNVTNNYYGGAAGASRFGGVRAGGPPINEINAHSRQHVQTVSLTAAAQPGRSTLQGNSLAVYAPRVNPATAQQARPATVAQTLNHPTFNRGASITKPLDVTANVHRAPPSAKAIQAAQQAQEKAPAQAKIATERTIKAPPAKPLTALQPLTPAPVQNHNEPGANAANGNGFNPSAGNHPQGQSLVNPVAPQAQQPNAFNPATHAPQTPENTAATGQASNQAQQEQARQEEAKQQQAQSQAKEEQARQEQAKQAQAQVEQQTRQHEAQQSQAQSEEKARQHEAQLQQAQQEQQVRQREVQQEQRAQQQQVQHQQAQAEIQHQPAPPEQRQQAAPQPQHQQAPSE